MPQRVAQGAKRMGAIVGIGGTIISYLAVIPRYIGLTPALNVFNAFLLGILLLFLWLLHRDLEEMKSSESGIEDENVSSDGGIQLSPQLKELQEESPEGGGALAGLIAGGAAGVLAGPAGAILGGVVGGILGNEAEYQQIVERYREELAKTAENALDTEPVHSPRPYTIENISHRSSDDTYAVLIEDGSTQQHRIRLNLDDKKYTYEDV